MIPTIESVISTLKNNSSSLGIALYDKATEEEIEFFEETKAIKLPDEIKSFYRLCNGLEHQEDMLRIIPLHEILEGDNDSYTVSKADFHIAEYMIYGDLWTITIDKENHNKYSIYNLTQGLTYLTNSFSEFLFKCISGGVFDGLYQWKMEIDKANKNL